MIQKQANLNRIKEQVQFVYNMYVNLPCSKDSTQMIGINNSWFNRWWGGLLRNLPGGEFFGIFYIFFCIIIAFEHEHFSL